MEYSVYDLVQALIKKWYIILLAMCIIGSLSVFTAQQSYMQAVENYETSVSETVSAGVDTGTIFATYLYNYELTDLSKYLTEAQRKVDFYRRFMAELGVNGKESQVNVSTLAEAAYTAISQEAYSLVTDARVLSETQTAMDAYHYVEPPVLNDQEELVVSTSPLAISNHLTVEILPESVVRLTVSGLEEDVSQQLLATYLKSLESVGRSDYSIKVSMTEQTKTFTLSPLRLSQSAQFAQAVMEKPKKAPIMVKTVGTATAFAFVLSCFLILVVTFIKDSQRAATKQTS